jgi:hypothetical protein
MNQCDGCRHFADIFTETVTKEGNCKRYPPTVYFAGDIPMLGLFPKVAVNDRCGEWAAKEGDGLKHTSSVTGVVLSETVARAVRKARRA